MIPPAPASFDGTLPELFASHIINVLPPVQELKYLHALLLNQCHARDAIFVVRQITGTERGAVYANASGERLLTSDNAPAWWMHYMAFNGIRPRSLAEMPTHMFDVAQRITTNVSAAGWHVAHIYNVNDRNTDWRNWTRAELVRRFIRNVHPCNCFYIPKAGWRRYGGDPNVIAFFAGEYARRYGAVWTEFRELAGAARLPAMNGTAIRYAYSADVKRQQPLAEPDAGGTAVGACYRFSRLCFKASVIEPLRDDDVFEVVTPQGTFRMTKHEFYRDFPGVVQSISYRERGIYHYSTTPKRALRYKR